MSRTCMHQCSSLNFSSIENCGISVYFFKCNVSRETIDAVETDFYGLVESYQQFVIDMFESMRAVEAFNEMLECIWFEPDKLNRRPCRRVTVSCDLRLWLWTANVSTGLSCVMYLRKCAC